MLVPKKGDILEITFRDHLSCQAEFISRVGLKWRVVVLDCNHPCCFEIDPFTVYWRYVTHLEVSNGYQNRIG